jgi:hypothetical protein
VHKADGVGVADGSGDLLGYFKPFSKFMARLANVHAEEGHAARCGAQLRDQVIPEVLRPFSSGCRELRESIVRPENATDASSMRLNIPP